MAYNPQMLLQQYAQVLSGNSFMLLYQMSHFCTQADLVLLLGIEVEADGNVEKIEDVCKVMQVDDYTYGFIPNSEHLAAQIILALKRDHPEFKIDRKMFDGEKIEDITVENESSQEHIKIITARVPEVNKDRHDALLKAIEALYDGCVGQFDWNRIEFGKRLATSMEEIDEEVIKKVTEKFDETTKQYEDIRDGYYKKKQEEIETAYAEYCKKQEAEQKEAEEKMLAEGKDAAQSMNMFDNIYE